MSRGSGFGVGGSILGGVGRVLLLRPAVVIAVTLAIALPASAQSARKDVASGVRRTSTEEHKRRHPPAGSTPLRWAVFNGDVPEVRRLLRAGANVSLANNYGATPMSLAAEVGHTEILKLLLRARAGGE